MALAGIGRRGCGLGWSKSCLDRRFYESDRKRIGRTPYAGLSSSWDCGVFGIKSKTLAALLLFRSTLSAFSLSKESSRNGEACVGKNVS
jgi:hypothetical protein